MEKQLRVWVHGDDFVLLGYMVNVRHFFLKLQEFILAFSGCHDCLHSIRVPSRIVEWTADGITWEADPQRAELIRKSFGVTRRSVTAPGEGDKLTDIEGEVPMDKEASDRCCSNTMCAQCDRPDIQIECDLARKMQQPSNLDDMGPKRLARFLGVRPRLVWLLKRQKRVTRIES